MSTCALSCYAHQNTVLLGKAQKGNQTMNLLSLRNFVIRNSRNTSSGLTFGFLGAILLLLT